jgi:hypothetical protein
MTDDATLGPIADTDDSTNMVFELHDMEASPVDELTLSIVSPYDNGHVLHPRISDLEVWLNYGVVHVHLPLMPAYVSVSYAIDDLTPNRWIRLTDSSGNPLPISLFREGDLRILGRWSSVRSMQL